MVIASSTSTRRIALNLDRFIDELPGRRKSTLMIDLSIPAADTRGRQSLAFLLGPPRLHQALHPLPARNEGGGPRRGETNKNAPPLPGPLLHRMEERGSLMQPCWTARRRFGSLQLGPGSSIDSVNYECGQHRHHPRTDQNLSARRDPRHGLGPHLARHSARGVSLADGAVRLG